MRPAILMTGKGSQISRPVTCWFLAYCERWCCPGSPTCLFSCQEARITPLTCSRALVRERARTGALAVSGGSHDLRTSIGQWQRRTHKLYHRASRRCWFAEIDDGNSVAPVVDDSA